MTRQSQIIKWNPSPIINGKFTIIEPPEGYMFSTKKKDSGIFRGNMHLTITKIPKNTNPHYIGIVKKQKPTKGENEVALAASPPDKVKK